MSAQVTEQLWVRVGDTGEYAAFDSLEEALAYLNECGVGEVLSWTNGPCAVGFNTPNFHGCDCVSCFWGDTDANLIRPLDTDERAAVEAGLEEIYIG